MDTATLRINSERLRADFEALSEFGALETGGVTRLALSNEDLEARAWFAGRLEDADLITRDDDAGNLGGVILAATPTKRTFLVGSHLDTPVNGGKYDGAIGVLAGLECLRTIRESGVRLPVNLEVINFTDEEGAWQSLLGSRALTGKLGETFMPVNDDQAAFKSALHRAGIFISDLPRARRDAADVVGYLELHIEQGARLYRSGQKIGLVTGIVGRTTCQVTFEGEAGHSGTTELAARKDALQGGAAFILDAHAYVRDTFSDGIFNCGNIRVAPGAFNTIPSEATLTWEVRHSSEQILDQMEHEVLALAKSCAERFGLKLRHRRLIHMPAARMSDWALETTEEVCQAMGVEGWTRLVSFAGHDAQMLSGFTQAGMIFIPSLNGISHNPQEFTEWDDVTLGANVLLQTLLRMASTF